MGRGNPGMGVSEGHRDEQRVWDKTAQRFAKGGGVRVQLAGLSKTRRRKAIGGYNDCEPHLSNL